MRFGAFVPQGWRMDLAGIAIEDHWPTMLGVARRIEDSGFESLWVYDHFHTRPVPSQEVTYEAWTLMAALAATTTRVRLGQMCTCNTYRPPAYLAKVAASIDAISGGRVEMGIGAGWYEHEHDGYGYPFLPPPQRLGMLKEGVEIMRALWTEDEVHYDGTYYRLKGGICQPKPVQKPHIPIWLAGGGEQVTLRLAAIHGDYSNFGGDLDTFVHKSRILEQHCIDVGRNFDEIVRSSLFNVICADTEREVAELTAWLADHMGKHVPPDGVQRFMGLFKEASGTTEQVAARLADWERAGLGYAIINFAVPAYDTSSLDLFAREVIPALS